MKKVAIVSCYFIHNYGSALQAFATQKVLDQLGYDNETINVSGFIKKFRKDEYTYIIKSGLFNGLLFDRFGKAKNLLMKLFLRNDYTRNINKRDEQFVHFQNNYFRLSNTYSSIDELGDKCESNYSQVLIGSDQLWLPANIAAGYYTLNFVPDNVNSIAYATSFGVSSLPKNVSKTAKQFLPRIKHLSVREKTGQELIKRLIGRSVPVVCDPTILLTAKEWMSIQSEDQIINEPYIFCYFISKSREYREFAKKLSQKENVKIVALTHIDCYVKNDKDYADITPYDIGPSEFINLIKNAKYICTDSFHCTVFSILYKKIFFCFKRYIHETNQSTNDRIETLLNHLGIQNRVLDGSENIDECLKIDLEYSSIDEKLESLREESYKYLIDSLTESRNTDL